MSIGLIEDEANQLHDQLAAWADRVRDQVRTERPALPDGIIGRFREKWGPLKRIAVTAGGDWPDRVDAMALHDKKAYEMDKEDGLIQEKPAVVLLSHIHKLWPVDTQFLPTEKLIDLLVDEYPIVWVPKDHSASGLQLSVSAACSPGHTRSTQIGQNVASTAATTVRRSLNR